MKPTKEYLCDACEDTGKDFYSCCAIDMRGKDYDNCPDCGEHTGWSGDIKDCEPCQDCRGEAKQMLVKA